MTFSKAVKWSEDTDVSLYAKEEVLSHVMGPAPETSTRGNAVGEILIEVPIDAFDYNLDIVSTVTLHGVCNNGILYETKYTTSKETPVLGRELEGWWTKGYVQALKTHERHVLLMAKQGYDFTNKIVQEKDLALSEVPLKKTSIRPPVAPEELQPVKKLPK